MMIDQMVEEEKKSSDLMEAERVAEAQALAYEALIKAQEAHRALVRLKEHRASLSKPNSPVSQAAPRLEPRRPEIDIALKVPTALESVPLSPAEQSRTTVEGAESPTVGSAPSFTSLPKSESILNKSTLGPKAVGFAKQGRKAQERNFNNYIPPEPSFPDPFGGPEGLFGDIDVDNLCGVAPPYEEEYIMYQPKRPQAQAQQQAVQLHQPNKLETTPVPAPTEAKPLAPPSKSESPNTMEQLKQIEAQELQNKAEEAPVLPPTQTRPSEEPTKPVSPKEEPTVAVTPLVVSPAKSVAAVGLAVRPEQPFPDPFGGVDDDTYDVDIDHLCGIVPVENLQAQQQQPTSPIASPTAAKPVEERVKPVVEPAKPVSPKEEPTVAAKSPVVSPTKTVAAVGLAVRPEQPFPDPFGGNVEEDTFDVDIDRLCGVVPDQVRPTAQPEQIQAQQQRPTSPVPAPTEAKPVEAPKEESTVDTESTVTPAVTFEVAKIEAPKEECTVDTDNTVTPAETAEVKPLEAAAAPTTPQAPEEESDVALEAFIKAADLASERQDRSEGVYCAIDNLCRSPQAEGQNEMQEEKVSPAPKHEEAKPEPEAPHAEQQNKIQEEPVSPAPKQEEAKLEEQLQLESQEQMIHAQAANACGCHFF
jgi:hypothetical protein